MVRKVLGLALCLGVLVGVLCLSVSAEEGQHSSHPICGAAHTGIGDHTGTCDNVTWTAWDGTSDITYDPITNAAYVYLTGETTLTDTLGVKSGYTLYLCLNGKTLKGTNNVITVEGGAALNICDCQCGGEITNTSAQDSPVKVDPDYKGTATLNLYGGKVSGSVNSGLVCDDGVVMLYNNAGDQKDNAAIFNMYGGEVCNTGSGTGSGIFVSYSRVGNGFFEVNIYGGTVASENTYGIDSSDSSNAAVLVAGGEVKGNLYAIRAIGNLKLSGSPLIHADEDEADIDIITGPASTPNDYITIADDFVPANETTISVFKSVDGTGSVRIAMPETGKPLDGKAEYFVAADEGYFVESKNGELYLTACAITKQPADEDYTVTANGSPDKLAYQWYSATKGDVPVTGENATASNNYRYSEYSGWYTIYNASSTGPVNLEAFTLHMNKGDVLTLTNARDVEGFSIAVAGGTSDSLGVPSWDSGISYTAPANGEYTLTVTATPERYDGYGGEIHYHLDASFNATVTAYVPGNQLEGQTAATLNTTGLSGGSYICQVTWEGKTTLSSQVVSYTAPHEHDWATEWSSDGTHHWHECQNADCDVTDVSQKEGYGTHTEDDPVIENKVDATCTAGGSYDEVVYCTTCRAQLSRTAKTIDALGHSYGTPTYTWIGTRCTATRVCANDAAHVETETAEAVVTVTQEKTCVLDELSKYEASFTNTAFAKQTKTDEKTADATGHTWTPATCTTPKTCSVCSATEGDALGHSWGKWTVVTPATEDAEGTERRVCRNDGSHRQTRAIPKLTPADCLMGDDCPLCGFGDLDSGAWYHDGVHYCLEKGLMQGFADGLFRPDGETTRAQLAMILWRLEGSPTVETAPEFDDVDPDAWYIGAVRWASAEGVVRGFGDGRFAPDEAVTREQMAAILCRCAARLGHDVSADGDLSGFADAASVSAYAVPALEWARATGLVEGIEQDGALRLAPGDPTTRAQMATLLLRFLTAA